MLEFANVIEALTEPSDASQPAFHLVLPSLPGYGFSGRPEKAGWSVEKIAEGWDVLMRGLGYERFVAHGSDFGAEVLTQLALFYPQHLAGHELAQHGQRANHQRRARRAQSA